MPRCSPPRRPPCSNSVLAIPAACSHHQQQARRGMIKNLNPVLLRRCTVQHCVWQPACMRLVAPPTQQRACRFGPVGAAALVVCERQCIVYHHAFCSRAGPRSAPADSSWNLQAHLCSACSGLGWPLRRPARGAPPGAVLWWRRRFVSACGHKEGGACEEGVSVYPGFFPAESVASGEHVRVEVPRAGMLLLSVVVVPMIIVCRLPLWHFCYIPVEAAHFDTTTPRPQDFLPGHLPG